jgi:hypothetical protein
VAAGRASESDERLLAAADRAASKRVDDSRNRGIAGQPTWPRYAVDHTTMSTFGDERDSAERLDDTCFLPHAAIDLTPPW